VFVLVSKQCVVLLIIDRERQQDLDERDAFTDRLKEEDKLEGWCQSLIKNVS